MRFIKTFESFDPASGETAEKKIAAKIKGMSPGDIDKAKKDLENLASKLKLSVEDLQDAEKVEAALKAVAPELSESELNEGLTEWWARVKPKAMSWLNKIGVAGILGSIAALGIGAEMMSPASEFTSATVTPNATVLIGIAALAISVTATLLTSGGSAKKTKPAMA